MAEVFTDAFWTLATAVLSFLGALLGYWMNMRSQRSNALQDAKIRRLQQQLEELYDPVCARLVPSENVWKAFRAKFPAASAAQQAQQARNAGHAVLQWPVPAPERGHQDAQYAPAEDSNQFDQKKVYEDSFFGGGEVTDDDIQAYKLYEQEVFYPLSREIVDIFFSKSHLLAEDEWENHHLALMQHYTAQVLSNCAIQKLLATPDTHPTITGPVGKSVPGPFCPNFWKEMQMFLFPVELVHVFQEKRQQLRSELLAELRLRDKRASANIRSYFLLPFEVLQHVMRSRRVVPMDSSPPTADSGNLDEQPSGGLSERGSATLSSQGSWDMLSRLLPFKRSSSSDKRVSKRK